MKCGICGKDTMRGYGGSGQLPIYDASDLSRHKKADHPTEYQEAIESRRAKTWTTQRAKVAEAQRVSDARLAASRPVVVRNRGEGEPMTCPSSKLARWQLISSWNNQPQKTDVRFPDAEAYHEYLSVMARIAGLEIEAKTHLTAAWERGTPVTLEHLDELDRAAIASPQAQ